MMRANWKILILALCAAGATYGTAANAGGSENIAFAQSKDGGKSSQGGQDKKEREPTPQEKMQARFPQPVQVGHLLGLPVLDGNDSTIGYVQQVVRTPEGKIKLIVPYRKRFGWARKGGMFDWGRRRPVAVPIETVAILALQIDALDMQRDMFDKAPTWTPSETQPIPADEIIKIAIQRR